MVFRRSKIPEPPPALAEPEPLVRVGEQPEPVFNVSADEPEPVPVPKPMPLSELVDILSEPAGLEPLADTEPPTAPPEPVTRPSKPIFGLDVGMVVHVMSNHQLCAGMITRVWDEVTGDCSVFVFEPVAPPRSDRRTYAGVHGDLTEHTWRFI